LIALASLLAPWIAPYGLHEQAGPVFGRPSASHPLGLDDGGIDMVTLLMWGARISLLAGFAATAVSMLIGGAVGILAGYFGGKVDVILMRVTDYFLVIPDVPLMIVVAAIWGPSLSHIIIVIGVLLWTSTARVLRAQVKSVRERTYVKRARALGAGHARIVLRHVLPQVAPLLIANTVLTIAVAIFDETALSFLGLGDPSRISLGKVIENAFERAAISSGAWWAIVPPGALVAVIILSCSLIGGALEDALNPRLRVAHLGARSFRLRPLVGRSPEAL
jgi:peptide/nickel transport system permease protein